MGHANPKNFVADFSTFGVEVLHPQSEPYQIALLCLLYLSVKSVELGDHNPPSIIQKRVFLKEWCEQPKHSDGHERADRTGSSTWKVQPCYFMMTMTAF